MRLLLGLCLPMILAPAAFAGDLILIVEDVPDASGSLRGAVYASEATFLNLKAAKTSFRTPAAKGQVRYVFHDLPAGRYALTVYQDKNDNGKLDRNDQNFPLEPYGFSNDALGSGGPPKFGQAAFDFDGKSKSISITLNY